MTETLTGMSSMPKGCQEDRQPDDAERAPVRKLVKAARARGEDLTGPGGLLKTINATAAKHDIGCLTAAFAPFERFP